MLDFLAEWRGGGRAVFTDGAQPRLHTSGKTTPKYYYCLVVLIGRSFRATFTKDEVIRRHLRR